MSDGPAPPGGEFVLTLSCPDRPGIVHAVAAYLYQAGCNILDSQQYADRIADRFFMRGATAHYVTAELDEGPIIEQEVARVDHRCSPGELAAIGRDAERIALARAVRWHAEHRILLHGRRTVIFR
jgi:formyltetrahydrofolate hydrolase